MSRKQYNPYKQAQRRYQERQFDSVNEIAVVQVFGDKQTYAWHRPTQRLVKPSHTIVKALFQHQYPWNIACIIACRTPQGGEWVRVWDVGPEQPEHHVSIAKDCQEKHIELLRTTPKHQQLNGCWIGTTTGEILSEEEIDTILKAVDMWGFITHYQDQLNKEKSCTSDA